MKTSRFCTLSARSRRVSGGWSNGDVADQVEGVEVLADLVAQGLEEHTLLLQLVDDGLLAVGLLPPLQEVVEGRELLLHACAGVVLERLGDELAVLVVVLDPLGDHRERHAADDVLPVVVRVSSSRRVGIVEHHVDLVVVGTSSGRDAAESPGSGLVD